LPADQMVGGLSRARCDESGDGHRGGGREQGNTTDG
jgi:hypothetical protein